MYDWHYRIIILGNVVIRNEVITLNNVCSFSVHMCLSVLYFDKTFCEIF